MIQRIPTLTQSLMSNNPASQLEATTEICKLLSKGHIALIDEVIRAGVVPQLVRFLAMDDIPQLQYMAAWTLTNISSGTSEHTRIVIEHDAVPRLVHLLCHSSVDDCKEQAIWALGNIAGDSLSTRDHVLSHGALLPILGLLWNPSLVKVSILKIASWSLSNLCRGDLPSTIFEQITRTLPFLGKLMLMSDEEVVANACLTVSYLTHEGSSELIQAVIQANVCPRLVQLLQFSEKKVIVPALWTLGDITFGVEAAHTQVLIDQGVLPCLKLLLSKSDKTVLKYACWVISNITAGTRAQMQAVIDDDLISPLVCLTKAEFDIKMEAAWAIVNATFGTHEQIQFLASKGCIEALCDLLTCSDPSVLSICLVGLHNILHSGKKNKNLPVGVNIYVEMVEECGGLEKIVGLQSYENNDIYNKAVAVLETYWHEELIPLDDTNLHNTEGGTGQGLSFGSNLPTSDFNFSEKN
ncbi:importin subunit alpha-4-like isoform X2 [Cicer arietinum]|nr:importin subunit alpha-4-like isoform X2 [Cicer arietinum]